MGHVLLQMGIFELATEHLGEAFRLAPTAESATFVGWALNEMDDAWGPLVGAAKRLRPTKVGQSLERYWGDPFANGAADCGNPWLAAATRSQRYDAPGHPWSNLARAHEALGNEMAAFDGTDCA